MEKLLSMISSPEALLQYGALGLLFLGMILMTILLRSVLKQQNKIVANALERADRREVQLLKAYIDVAATLGGVKEVLRSMRGIVANCPHRLLKVLDEGEKKDGPVQPEGQEIKDEE